MQDLISELQCLIDRPCAQRGAACAMLREAVVAFRHAMWGGKWLGAVEAKYGALPELRRLCAHGMCIKAFLPAPVMDKRALASQLPTVATAFCLYYREQPGAHGTGAIDWSALSPQDSEWLHYFRNGVIHFRIVESASKSYAVAIEAHQGLEKALTPAQARRWLRTTGADSPVIFGDTPRRVTLSQKTDGSAVHAWRNPDSELWHLCTNGSPTVHPSIWGAMQAALGDVQWFLSQLARDLGAQTHCSFDLEVNGQQRLCSHEVPYSVYLNQAVVDGVVLDAHDLESARKSWHRTLCPSTKVRRRLPERYVTTVLEVANMEDLEAVARQHTAAAVHLQCSVLNALSDSADVINETTVAMCFEGFVARFYPAQSAQGAIPNIKLKAPVFVMLSELCWNKSEDNKNALQRAVQTMVDQAKLVVPVVSCSSAGLGGAVLDAEDGGAGLVALTDLVDKLVDTRNLDTAGYRALTSAVFNITNNDELVRRFVSAIGQSHLLEVVAAASPKATSLSQALFRAPGVTNIDKSACDHLNLGAKFSMFLKLWVPAPQSSKCGTEAPQRNKAKNSLRIFRQLRDIFGVPIAALVATSSVGFIKNPRQPAGKSKDGGAGFTLRKPCSLEGMPDEYQALLVQKANELASRGVKRVLMMDMDGTLFPEICKRGGGELGAYATNARNTIEQSTPAALEVAAALAAVQDCKVEVVLVTGANNVSEEELSAMLASANRCLSPHGVTLNFAAVVMGHLHVFPSDQKLAFLQLLQKRRIEVVAAVDDHGATCTLLSKHVPVLRVTDGYLGKPPPAFLPRTLLVWGPMGSGKSTLLRHLQGHAGLDMRTYWMDGATLQSDEGNANANKATLYQAFTADASTTRPNDNAVVALDMMNLKFTAIDGARCTCVLLLPLEVLTAAEVRVGDVYTGAAMKATFMKLALCLKGNTDVRTRWADMLETNVRARYAALQAGQDVPESTFLPKHLHRGAHVAMVDVAVNAVTRGTVPYENVIFWPTYGTTPDGPADVAALGKALHAIPAAQVSPKCVAYAGFNLGDFHSTTSYAYTTEYARRLLRAFLCKMPRCQLSLMGRYAGYSRRVVKCKDAKFEDKPKDGPEPDLVYDVVEPDAQAALWYDDEMRPIAHVTRKAPPGKASLCGDHLRAKLEGGVFEDTVIACKHKTVPADLWAY